MIKKKHSVITLFNRSIKSVNTCLSTLINKDASCYTGIVENLLIKLDGSLKEISQSKIIIVKFTIPHGRTKKWIRKFYNLIFVSNPEFLKEVNADRF